MIIRGEERPTVEVEPGVERSILQHGERLMLVRITLAEGTAVAPHAHPHEQITHVIEGRVRFTLDGETYVLEPGDSCLISPNRPHGAVALADCVLIDAFSPIREDFLP